MLFNTHTHTCIYTYTHTVLCYIASSVPAVRLIHRISANLTGQDENITRAKAILGLLAS